MKFWLSFLIFTSTSVFANDELKSTYLEFESSYMSNSKAKYAPWLSSSYKIIQTMHVPSLGSDSREATGAQMLAMMEKMNTPNTMPRSTKKNTEIEVISSTEFCAFSTTINQTNISGKNYEEKEVRKVCFIKQANNYLANTHNIDVYYKEI